MSSTNSKILESSTLYSTLASLKRNNDTSYILSTIGVILAMLICVFAAFICCVCITYWFRISYWCSRRCRSNHRRSNATYPQPNIDVDVHVTSFNNPPSPPPYRIRPTLLDVDRLSLPSYEQVQQQHIKHVKLPLDYAATLNSPE
uniref:Uncharacterized protein n=1 Tax=Acrobeloides nanus TaxID=290746 RepID=A0A914DE65_9BILA